VDYAENHSKYLSIHCVSETPEIQAVLSSFFSDSNDIAHGSNKGGGWA